MEINTTAKKENGFALLLAIVIASILLAVGLTMLSITVKQLTLSSMARESEVAFHAASAGLECVRFHRRKNGSYSAATNGQYTNHVSGSGSAPNINCFNVTPSVRDQSNLHGSGSGNYTNEFNYEFSWGSGDGARCSRMDMYVMNAADSDYQYNFTGLSSVVGNKECPSGSACSVVIARGYNRSCADVRNGLATVEREVTAQF